MPRESSAPLGKLLGCLLVVGLLAPASCRVGYEELDAVNVAGASGVTATNGGGTNGGAANGGGGSANGGSTAPDAGEGPPGGAGDAPSGGTPTNGGAAVGGSMSGGSSSGNLGGAEAAGAGGAGPTPSGCVTTPDCICRSNAGRSYWFCKVAMEWDASEAHCESQAMQLARIDSQAENDYLVSTGFVSGVFNLNGFAQIGANDRAVAGEWRWVDGEQFWQGGPNGTPVGGLFSNWLISSPSSSGVQECTGLLATGDWQVRSCTAVVPFICESP